MAKKKSGSSFNFTKVGKLLDGISDKISIDIEKEVKSKKFIDTGIYLLNAAMSGDMLNGGIQHGKIFTLAGDSGTGKSFIALSICKKAQESGMGVIYIDTEQAIDLVDLPNYGIDNDPSKFILVRANKVEDINITLTQLLDELKEEKKSSGEIEPFLIVLDSVGQMSSNKEKEDLLKGDIKQDMTRAKALAAMFRSINNDLGILGIPMVVCNHVYLEQGMFPKQVIKGGKGLYYSSSIIGMLSKAKLKDGNEDDMDLGGSGIVVTFKTEKNRMAKPKKIKIEISMHTGVNKFSGLEMFCRPEYYDQIGIAKGKEEVDKETGEITFKPGGTRWFVRHLGKSVFQKNLFTSEVFTQEVLENMAPIINEYFKYKSLEEMEEVNKRIDDLLDEDETNGFLDAPDAEDLF